jgi:hypothetical protein
MHIKELNMNKIILVILLAPLNVFSQQCNFNELISLCTDIKKFELKMFALENTMLDLDPLKKRWDYHVEDTINNEVNTLSSDKIPTNDPKYKEVIGYEYTPLKIYYCRYYENYYSHFAENYNEQTKQASTWYWFKYRKGYTTIQNEGCSHIEDWEDYSLQIEFVRNSDYTNLLEKVQLLCDYEGTIKMWGGFWSVYKYKQFKVKLNKTPSGRGEVLISSHIKL